MIKRNVEGYYRCKVKYSELYEEMTRDMARFLDPKMISMLQHDWLTQTHEAMDQLVASYAPKNKTYSKSKLLLTQVYIAAAIQIVGNSALWTMVFLTFGLIIDGNLDDILECKDRKNMRNKARGQSKDGKTICSTKNYMNLAEGHKAQMLDLQKSGVYESGIAVTAARKSIKAIPNRNKGDKETWTRVYYHPNFFFVKGHKDCRSVAYAMKLCTKEQREAALKIIGSDKIQDEIKKLSQKGKLILLSFFFSVVYKTYQISVVLTSANKNSSGKIIDNLRTGIVGLSTKRRKK